MSSSDSKLLPVMVSSSQPIFSVMPKNHIPSRTIVAILAHSFNSASVSPTDISTLILLLLLSKPPKDSRDISNPCNSFQIHTSLYESPQFVDCDKLDLHIYHMDNIYESSQHSYFYIKI